MVALSEKYLEIIYQILLLQNRRLLREIAIREKLPVQDLYHTFLNTRKEFQTFIHHLPPFPLPLPPDN